MHRVPCLFEPFIALDAPERGMRSRRRMPPLCVDFVYFKR
jgi:hypothetical protein